MQSQQARVRVMASNEYTPTEQRILNLLADGLPHTRIEVFQCLWDDMGNLSNIRFHLSRLRGKLHRLGETIVCEIRNRRICYRHIRLLQSMNGQQASNV